jgi:tRNA/tmRNA/rRNA uracil-C5-methylase (TrmA/RlmC/RlmD family)
VYVSCNPTTQARDVALLMENGYELKKLSMVDMFPHTPHIETVGVLEKN